MRRGGLLVCPALLLLTACSFSLDYGEDDGFAQGKGKLLVAEERSGDYDVDPAEERIARAGIYAGGGVYPLGVRDLDDVDGSFTALTGPDVLVSTPRWTPDGAQIVYIEHDDLDYDSHSRLSVIAADGSGQQTLELSTAPDEYVDDILAIDESGVVTYEVGDTIGDEGDGFFTINLDGTGRQPAAAYVGGRNNLALDPSGERVLWTEYDDSGYPAVTRIYVGRPESTEGVEVAQGYSPTWSPDGSRIAYLAFSGEEEDDGLPLDGIHVVAADGSGEPEIVPGLDCCMAGRLTWLDDDRIIVAYTAYVVGDHELYTLDASGVG